MAVLHLNIVATMLLRLLIVTLLVSPPAPAIAEKPESSLDEVIVTAQRRQSNIQDAAIALSVLSGKDFDRSNIVRLDNFNAYVPGLTIAKNDGAGRVVSIRGVGWETAQNLSTQPSVLIYVDGVYMANPLAIGTDLGDIERIEVFRGPQGTEFGQGTIGGAINIVTIKPSLGDISGSVELAAGSYNLIRARGALNVPLGDRAAVRASVQTYGHDGFAEIEGGPLDGYGLDDADSTTGKISLLWQAGDSWSLSLSAFSQDSAQSAAAQRNIDDPNADVRRLSQDFPGKFALENTLISAMVEWRLPSGATLKSITGYQELSKKQTVDGDRLNETLTSFDLFGFFNIANWDVLTIWDNDSDAFSQELSLSHSSDSVDWVVGAYYLDHENSNFFLEANGPAPFSDAVPALADPGPGTLPPFASVLNFVEARVVKRQDWATYAQASWQVSNRVALVAGGRYQSERQSDRSVQFWDQQFSQKLHDRQFTWKLGLDFSATANSLLYGLASTGWKNGGTNPGAANGSVNLPIVFKPAEVTSFELGSRNTFANDKLRLNIAIFFYDYDNLQFAQEDPTPFVTGTGNIPSTRVFGIETEFNWLLADDWRLDGFINWQDGEFEDDFSTLDSVDFREALESGVIGLFTPQGFDLRLNLSQNTNLKGNKPPKLVDFSARLALSYKRRFANSAELTSRLEFIHRGEYQYRVFNNPLVDTVPSYSIVNLLFSYQFANEYLGLALGASNLFDEDGVNSRFSNPFGLLTTSEEFIPPRELVVSLRYVF